MTVRASIIWVCIAFFVGPLGFTTLSLVGGNFFSVDRELSDVIGAIVFPALWILPAFVFASISGMLLAHGLLNSLLSRESFMGADHGTFIVSVASTVSIVICIIILSRYADIARGPILDITASYVLLSALFLLGRRAHNRSGPQDTIGLE